MGYTHYWDNHTFEIDEDMIDDVNRIISKTDVSVRDGNGGSSPCKPILELNRIVLNAAAPNTGETLNLMGETPGFHDPEFECCKPCNEPYDALVTAVLIRVAETNPETSIRSDGTFNDDWRAGRELFKESLGREPVCPKDVALRITSWENDCASFAHVSEFSQGRFNVYAPLDLRLKTSRAGKSLDFSSREETVQWLNDGGYKEIE